MNYLIISFISIVIGVNTLVAQTSSSNWKSEKILLHTDKELYTQTDTIKITGSIREATTLQPSTYSNYLYVELIDKNDSVWIRQKWTSGPEGFKGRLPLDYPMKAGTWYIRAYTRLMCNFPENTFSITPIQIEKPFYAETIDTTLNQVRFYPEGGHLLPNQLQTVAFEALNKNGVPICVQATLLNDSQDTIASGISTFVNGIGRFSFIPRKETNYFLQIDTNKYICPQTEQLPVLQLNCTREKIHYKILVPESNTESFQLILFHRGALCMKYPITAMNNEGFVDMTGYSSGIVAGLLTDKAKNILSERLLFFTGTEQDTLKEINTKAKGILLLTSDLLYPIRNVEMYFDKTNPEIATALDCLMLTQKWGRFEWKGALEENFYYKYKPETVMALTGEVYTESGAKLKQGTIIGINNASGFTYDAEIKDGRFTMGVDNFPDKNTFFMQAYTKKGKSKALHIIPDKDRYPGVINLVKQLFRTNNSAVSATYKIEEMVPDNTETNLYHLPEVVVNARILQKEPSSEAFYGVRYIGEEQLKTINKQSLISYLERMIGFSVITKNTLEKGKEYALVSTRGSATYSGTEKDNSLTKKNPNELTVLVDGSPVETTWAIQSLDMADIASIEVLSPGKALQYTSGKIAGAVLIKLKGYTEPEFKSKGLLYMPPGLSY